MKSIALIGFMGSGKSTIGSRLAKLTGLDFLDLDEVTMELAGADVADIFSNQGEEAWRAWECQALKQIAAVKESVVLACGGGVILRDENREILRSQFLTIYLKTSVEALLERLRHRKNRPLLDVADPKAAIARLFEERREIYEAVPHVVIVTDGKRPQDVAQEALEAVLATDLQEEFDKRGSSEDFQKGAMNGNE